MKKLRLVRFLIQPEIIADENGELSPLPGPVNPLTVPAVGWKEAVTAFANGGFDSMLADLEQRLNEAPENRATRRRVGKAKR